MCVHSSPLLVARAVSLAEISLIFIVPGRYQIASSQRLHNLAHVDVKSPNNVPEFNQVQSIGNEIEMVEREPLS